MPRKVVCACGQALAVPDDYPKPAARCSACGATVAIPPVSAAKFSPLTAEAVAAPFAPPKSPPLTEPTLLPPPPVSNDSRVLWVILGLLGGALVLFCGCGGVLLYALSGTNNEQQAQRPAPRPNFPQPVIPPPPNVPSPPVIPQPPAIPQPPPTPPPVTIPAPAAPSNDEFNKRRIYIPFKFRKVHLESLRKTQDNVKDNLRFVESMQKTIDRLEQDFQREIDVAAERNQMTRSEIEALIREGEEKKW